LRAEQKDDQSPACQDLADFECPYFREMVHAIRTLLPAISLLDPQC
jgi:hypothetical protein